MRRFVAVWREWRARTRVTAETAPPSAIGALEASMDRLENAMDRETADRLVWEARMHAKLDALDRALGR